MFKKVSIAVIAAGAALISAPASGQIDLGVGADVDLGVDVRVGEPYTYRGYESGRWYPYDPVHRERVYYERYGGYDCYKAFRYTWHDRHRARYDAYWCFDERGRRYEVDDTRVVVRIG